MFRMARKLLLLKDYGQLCTIIDNYADVSKDMSVLDIRRTIC